MAPNDYNSAHDAIKDIDDAYNYWSGKITETSTSFALGLIAANWAVYGTDGLKAELLPRLSVCSALLLLLLSLIQANRMAALHDKQSEYAEKNQERWGQEFEQAKHDTNANPWPYTKRIECWGWWGRQWKTWLPVIGCLLFLVSFI